jgi:NAD(P)-dependent dehydrogenase (short-subunit alcohol dehydrogenase family)
LIGLTEALAAEYGAQRVRVNAILPGAVDTAMHRQMNDTPESKTFMTNQHAFTVASWLEHLRQHQRVTNADRVIQDAIRQFDAAAQPKVTHFIAVSFGRSSSVPHKPGS